MSLSVERVIEYDRLVAPAEQLGVLIEPVADRLHALLTRPTTPTDDTPLLDTTAGALRRELLDELGLTGPVILTGHQPEFIHAGVFAKNIAADELARQTGGTAVFLTVDSDLPKTAQLALPQQTASGIRRVEVQIPGVDLQRPYEFQPRVPRDHWLQFFARFAALYQWHDRSLLHTFAYQWLTAADRETVYCDAHAAAVRATETALGLRPLREVRISALCATRAFRVFAAHLLLHAGDFAQHYNAAQAAFRRRHRVRAVGRPVPLLATHGDAIEVPLWIGRADGARHRLFVRTVGEQLELYAERERVAELAVGQLAQSASHATPWPLEAAGWHLRPRALTLSAFTRYCLSELFIHGVGGAKYDEMMEAFAAAALGMAPRPLACVSATVRLPLPATEVTRQDLHAARQRARDVQWNPQRHLRDVPPALAQERAALVRQSAELRQQRPHDRAARRLVFQEIRRVNARLLEHDPWRPAEYARAAEHLEQQQADDAVAMNREYFYALHPRETLAELVARVRNDLSHP